MDCDGRITANEMQYFYEEQLHRMECMAQEPVLFEDICCQMNDMINPQVISNFVNLFRLLDSYEAVLPFCSNKE